MLDAHPRPPASTQVLANTDLLYTIFTFVPLAPNARDNRLARCARISHTFHEPAVRALWRNLNTLLPLWHLLAPSNTQLPDQEKFSSFSDDAGMLEYLQAVISAELHRDRARWHRFLYHATHVRRIAHGLSATPAINDANRLLINTMIAQNGGTTFLPLLHTIAWLHPIDNTLTPFFTSSLRRATITFKGTTEATSISSLRKLRDASPFLEKADLYSGFGRDGSLGLSLIQEVADFSCLRDVRIARCSAPEVLRLLATRTNLKCLKICQITGHWDGPVNEDTIVVRGLHRLSVSGDASTLSRFFTLARFQTLKAASILLMHSLQIRLAPTDIRDFLALFYDAVSDLQELQLTPCIYSFRGLGGALIPALRELIAPILPISHLRSFTLSANRAVATLDDADITAIATAWPRLEHFSVSREFSYKSSVSINAMHCLHQQCADLQDLSIPQIRWPTIGVDTIPAPLRHSHPLRRLSFPGRIVVKASPPVLGPDLSNDCVEGMARYLLDLFPRLDLDLCRHELENSGPGPGLRPEDVQADGQWSKVIGRILCLCRARDGL